MEGGGRVLGIRQLPNDHAVAATAVAATTIVPDPLDVPGLDQVCGVMGSGTVAGLLQLQGQGLKLGQSFNSVKLEG